MTTPIRSSRCSLGHVEFQRGACWQSTFPIAHRRPKWSAVDESRNHAIANSMFLVGCWQSADPAVVVTHRNQRVAEQTNWMLWICVAEGPLDGGSSSTPSGRMSHVWKVKPHAAIGRTLYRATLCAPMKTRGRGLPLRKKEAQPDQRPSEAHCFPLSSGAQREDVQMQVEGSEGGMTSGAFSQNALRTGVYEAARGSICPNCAASVWEEDVPGMTLARCTSRGRRRLLAVGRCQLLRCKLITTQIVGPRWQLQASGSEREQMGIPLGVWIRRCVRSRRVVIGLRRCNSGEVAAQSKHQAAGSMEWALCVLRTPDAGGQAGRRTQM